MKKVTLQEVFDRVVTHLLTQNARSMHPHNPEQCMYRGNNGMMCAVGCLIPDDLYVPDMDSRDDATIRMILKRYELKGVFDFKVTDTTYSDFLKFLIDLQQIHDSVEPDNWKFNLQTLAERNKLQFRDTV